MSEFLSFAEEKWKELFYSPRKWRLKLEDIRSVKMRVLRAEYPDFHVLFHVDSALGEFQFYEAFTVKRGVRPEERVLGKVKRDSSEYFLVDSYSCPEAILRLFKSEKGDLRTSSWISLDRLSYAKPLFTEGEPTTNYLYEVREPACIVKRYLPRWPFDRGNRELRVIESLPPAIVPKVFAQVFNKSLEFEGIPQILVLFLEKVVGEEVGAIIWREMEEASRLIHMKMPTTPVLEKLMKLMERVVDEVLVPFHRSGEVREFGKEEAKLVEEEVEKDLGVLVENDVIKKKEAEGFKKKVKKALEEISDIPCIMTHGDLMWRQILRSVEGNLVIIDLDDAMYAHAARDLASLMAATRFIAECLPTKHRKEIIRFAESLNDYLLACYAQRCSGEEWARDIGKCLTLYLALRHLHDAAYYAPVSRASKGEEKKRYEDWVKFSMKWAFHELKRLP